MTVYRRKQSQPLKWLVALVVFALALGITFSEVHGYNGTGIASDITGPYDDNTGGPSGGSDDLSTDDTPTPVPEPATLLLLAGGLSALYVARRRKNRNK